jgi:hypothetical protein
MTYVSRSESSASRTKAGTLTAPNRDAEPEEMLLVEPTEDEGDPLDWLVSLLVEENIAAGR